MSETRNAYGESDRVARWRQRNWDRHMSPSHVEEIINAVGDCEKEIVALRATIVERDGQVAALRAVIEETIPRYAEMFEACGLGNPTESVAIQDMVAVLAAPPIDSAPPETPQGKMHRSDLEYLLQLVDPERPLVPPGDIRSTINAMLNSHCPPINSARQEADEWQREVGEWADATFPHSTPDSIIAHLSDEVEELADLTVPDAFEAADCYLLLLHLAHKRGFSLMEMAREKHAINQKRQWGNADERGVVRHVDSAPSVATEAEEE